MIKIMFVCHGNICRSPMAEFVMKDMVKKAGLKNKICVASSATSREEIGNDIHHGTKAKLFEMSIPFCKRQAVQLTAKDYENYDYIIAMDRRNLANIERICGRNDKTSLLLSYAGQNRDIADPWYTGNFDETYDDVVKGCSELLTKIKNAIEQ